MRKRVVVIASGETERRALPHLLQHLPARHIKVRIPPRQKALSIDVVFKLIQSARYELAPTKYVVLIDLDGKDPGCVLNPLRSGIETRLDEHLNSQVKYAYAQWHLEAWYFGDAENLREYLGGRALGSVDSSQPDTIHNPKLHLRNLLGDEFYTARISEAIAKKLNPSTIAGRSPSFKVFLTSVMNGAHQLERE